MSHTKFGSNEDIINRVYNDLGGKVDKYYIKKIIDMFYGRLGIMKYLQGLKSFSVNRLFFFSVHRNKLKIVTSQKLKKKKKANKKYWRKFGKRDNKKNREKTKEKRRNSCKIS